MKNKPLIIFLLFLFLIQGCREKYEMRYESQQTSYLVVEGIINTQGVTKVNLSRTAFISEKGISYENGAALEIEGEDYSTYPLVFEDSGRYVSANLMLNEDIRYRLKIQTRDNREYISSFVQPIKTPEIDSITWTRYQGGIEIFVNSKDVVNNTRYYKFDYEETWEFRSYYSTNLITVYKRKPPEVGDIVVGLYDSLGGKIDSSIWICWQSKISSGILTGTTVRLGENKLYAPIVAYPKGSWQFSYLYTMNLRQQGLSKEGYDFFQKMKKNTESLGSIFDAQPSEIPGNVLCVTDTSEKIIGFVDASRIKFKRIFIKNSDLKDWDFYEDCQLFPIDPTPSSLYNKLYIGLMLPIGYGDGGKLLIADKECVDCTLRGTNIKPSFWPN